MCVCVCVFYLWGLAALKGVFRGQAAWATATTAAQWTLPALGGGGGAQAQAVLQHEGAGGQHGHRARQQPCNLLPLGWRDEGGGEGCGYHLLLHGAVHQVHSLQRGRSRCKQNMHGEGADFCETVFIC